MAAPRGTGGHSPVLARLEEEKAPGVWQVSVRGQWHAASTVQLVLPGGARPQLAGGSYGLENHRQENVPTVHSGTSATLHCPEHILEGALGQVLRSGIYMEAVQG